MVNNVTLEDAGDYACKAVQVSSRITEMKDLIIDVKVHRELISCAVVHLLHEGQAVRHMNRWTKHIDLNKASLKKSNPCY